METEAYQCDTVTVGQLMRWINDEHLEAAKQSPTDLLKMQMMQLRGRNLESIFQLYIESNTQTRSNP
jgi:hypothetical protein